MLKDLEFTEDWRCFKKGDLFTFRPGVNLLVGDQGCGKSSLLQAIAAASKAKKYTYERGLEKRVKVRTTSIKCGGFDFEKDNRRTQSYFDSDLQTQLSLMFSSHGQGNLRILQEIADTSNLLLFLDEPDMALSIRSIVKLANIFKTAANKSCQIIAAVHNPILIQEFEVYSLESRKWLDGREFVASQLDF